MEGFLVLDASEASAPRRVGSHHHASGAYGEVQSYHALRACEARKLIASRFKVGSSEGEDICTKR